MIKRAKAMNPADIYTAVQFRSLGMPSFWAKFVGLFMVSSVMLSLGACHKKPEAKKSTNVAAIVSYSVAQTKVLPMVIEGTGTVGAWQEAPIGAEVGGLTAVAIYVDEGQYIKQGQPLLKMNDVLLAAQYRQAEAQADTARKAYGRAQEVHAKGFMSNAALDQADSAHKSAMAALDTAKTQLSMATVRAPISGVVTERKAVLGQIIAPGQELFTIVRDGVLEFNMELTEKELKVVKPQQWVSISSDTIKETQGRVRLVTPVIDPQTRLGYARVTIPWSSGIRPGSFARGLISVEEIPVVTIPKRAVVYDENRAHVFVIGPQNRVRAVPIEMGQIQGEELVVLAGVEAGDKVVSVGAGFLVDGDAVDPRSSEITKIPVPQVKSMSK